MDLAIKKTGMSIIIIYLISHVKNKTLFSFILSSHQLNTFCLRGAGENFTVFGPHNYYLLPINVKISATASCWKENLSLDRPCESINKLSISLQLQVEDLIHFNTFKTQGVSYLETSWTCRKKL